jgi:hypothetical protein
MGLMAYLKRVLPPGQDAINQTRKAWVNLKLEKKWAFYSDVLLLISRF